MSRTKVLLIGAAGETGGSIVNGLLENPIFEIHALVRPKSALKPAIVALQERGLQIRKGDLRDTEEELAEFLVGIDVVISCVGPSDQQEQISLAKAAKKAGVQRFVPCAFLPVAPPETVYNHIKQLRLPYTIIDVGWWYQIAYPRLDSGRVDYAMTGANNEIVGDGNTPMAITDLRDVGRYVAKIILDDRTLNKMVLAYNTVMSQNQVYDLFEEISEEKIPRVHISEEMVYSRVLAARQASETYPFDPIKFLPRYMAEYQLSWGIRGDNSPEYAKYLGYLTSKELYPDFTPIDFREYLETVVKGTAKGVYTDRTISKAQQRMFPRSESTDSLQGRLFPRNESSDSLYMSR